MFRFNITVKIWLSVGVYILGYVLSTMLGQVHGLQDRRALQATAEALFPAAQHSHEAEAAFQRMVKGFGDAVIMQDAAALDKASEDGRQAIGSLKKIAAIPDLAAGRSREAGGLADSLEQLLSNARTTYSAVLSNSLSGSDQDQVKAIAQRTDVVKSALATAKAAFASDLQQQLGELSRTSASQSRFSIFVFLATLVLAGIIVHLTIRRSITGPVLRVIEGVQTSADQSSHASEQVARSGSEVSSNAQEQAACIEETSASLEEIAATTRQNAERAGDADHLMQQARQTVESTAMAMQELTASMNLISKSSNQVACVLKNIDEIAFHTNILALNAAVEAARAGESGAGFSVVADEVRSLAHRAAEAARTSGAIIEQTAGDVAKGVELVARAHSAFQQVTVQISSGTEMVTQIATSSNQQAQGIAQIGKSITQIETLTQRNVETAQRTADAATAMASQAANTRQCLDELVAVVGTRS